MNRLIICILENKNLVLFPQNKPIVGQIYATAFNAKQLSELINAYCSDYKKGRYLIRKEWTHKNRTFSLAHELNKKTYSLEKAVNDWRYYFPENTQSQYINFPNVPRGTN